MKLNGKGSDLTLVMLEGQRQRFVEQRVKLMKGCVLEIKDRKHP